MLLREQSEHATALMKLKDKFMQEEESTKKMYAMQIETLKKDNEVALSKIESSKSVQQLTQQLAAEKDARQAELESKLERVGKEMAFKKAQWEDGWNKASEVRVEERHKQMEEELLQWRKQEIDDLIRRSILEQASHSASSEDETTMSKLASDHEDRLAALNKSLREQKESIEEVKSNFASVAAKKSRLINNIKEVKEDITDTEDRLQDMTNSLDRRKNTATTNRGRDLIKY